MNIEHKHNVLQPNFDGDNIENALKSGYKFSIYQENERYIINAKYKDKTRGFLSKKSVEDIRQTISQTKETTTNFNYNKENIKNNLMNLLNAGYTINIFYNSDNLFQTQVIQNGNIIKSGSYTYLTTSLAIIIGMSSQNIEKVIS